MPELVPIKCPECGAAVNVEKGSDIVECGYCGTDSFIRRPKQPAAQPDPMRSAPAPTRPTAPARKGAAPSTPGKSSNAWLLVPVALVAVVVGVLILGQSLWSGEEPSTGPASSGAPLATKKVENPVRAEDPKRVEPLDLLRQSLELAKTVDPGAGLISAHFPELIRGAVDLTKKNWANRHAIVEFEYRRKLPDEPPGQDVAQGAFRIYVLDGGFHIDMKSRKQATTLTGANREHYPLELPKCSGKQAWEAAVKSGVPATVTPNVHWRSSILDEKVEWSFQVEGRKEYRREVDADSCAVLGVWDEFGNRVK